MYQGETVSVVISGFPVDVSTIRHIRIAFMMQKTVMLELTESECEFDYEEQTVSFKLSQEQSLSIKSGTVARHVIIVTNDGSRLEAKIEDELVKYTAIPEVL